MKYLILSLGTGGGHNAAANAVAQSLKERGCEVEVVDCFNVVSSFRSKLVCSAYLGIVKYVPKLFGTVYKLSFHISSPRRKSVVYAVNASNSGKLADFINEKAPDGVITTHIFGAQQLTYLRRHDKISCWLAGVVTDYDVQPFWDETELDAVFTPHESFNEKYEKLGLPPEVLIATGIPADPCITERLDIRAAKRAHGLDENRKHVLVAGGSMGAGKLPDSVMALNEGLGKDVQITVVCGNNRKLMRKFNRMRLPESRLKVLGFVKPLHELMSAADVIITKPGGLSSTEAFLRRVPVVVAHPIEGVESNNALFMRENGLALCPKTDDELVSSVKKLLNNSEASEAMLENQRRIVAFGASGRDADAVIAAAENGKQKA